MRDPTIHNKYDVVNRANLLARPFHNERGSSHVLEFSCAPISNAERQHHHVLQYSVDCRPRTAGKAFMIARQTPDTSSL